MTDSDYKLENAVLEQFCGDVRLRVHRVDLHRHVRMSQTCLGG